MKQTINMILVNSNLKDPVKGLGCKFADGGGLDTKVVSKKMATIRNNACTQIRSRQGRGDEKTLPFTELKVIAAIVFQSKHLWLRWCGRFIY